jgi:hypothetical protein
MDRLSNSFYTDKEISELRRQVRTSKWYKYNNGMELVGKHILWLKLYGSKGCTGKIMIISTEDVEDTFDDIREAWSETLITPTIGGVIGPMLCADELVDSILMVLDASGLKYTTKYPELLGSNLVYTNDGLAEELLKRIR